MRGFAWARVVRACVRVVSYAGARMHACTYTCMYLYTGQYANYFATEKLLCSVYLKHEDQ